MLGLFAFFLTLPPVSARSPWWPRARRASARSPPGIWAVTRGVRRPGWGAIAAGLVGIALGLLSTRASVEQPRSGRRRGRRSSSLDARLGDTADLRGDRRHVLRAERRREHRPRGNDARRRVLWRARRGQVQLMGAGARLRGSRRRRLRARARGHGNPLTRRSDRQRHCDQLPRTRCHRLLLHPDLRRERDARGPPADSRREHRMRSSGRCSAI